MAVDWVVWELECEINRIFGEDGVRNLIELKVKKLNERIENSTHDDDVLSVEIHDQLVKHLEKLNEELPF